ncbi:LamG domain-containing protein [Natronosalvus rutilus]|uniref:LamG domain-containing protein n=1 Tax=Natronosalvus rutilus TaxID=2953753 RepID=A0A9E7NFB0_9EURY|nr:LamG domain-containing protein [Natronosalvus rutilus]UTF55973.1 LamG domain-containing protein [Natronosalvus rutilus]
MTHFNLWRDLTTGDPIYRNMADRADYHWKIDEGSGGTITCSVTGEVGTINGASWVSGDWIGGYGLEFAAGDWVQFDLDSTAFGGEEQMWVSVAFTDYEPNNRGILASVVDTSDSDRWNLETGSWDQDGRIGWWMSGDNNITSGAGSVSADTQYHTIGIHDNLNDNREIMLNDQSMNTTTSSGTVPGGEPTTFKIGRRGSGSREFVGVIGEVMIGFTGLTRDEKTALYDRQPFSQ